MALRGRWYFIFWIANYYVSLVYTLSYWIYKTFIFCASGLHQFELLCFRSNLFVFRTPGGTELESFSSTGIQLTFMSHNLWLIWYALLDLTAQGSTNVRFNELKWFWPQLTNQEPKIHFDECWEIQNYRLFDSRSVSNRKTKMVQFGLYISLCILTMSWVVYRGSFWFGIARFTINIK